MSGEISKSALWTGRIMSAIPALIILFGAVMKLMKPAPVIQGFAESGMTETFIRPVGIMELLCVIVYLIPSTAVLGAILMTGLLGGAIITELRIGHPTFFLPFVFGLLVWGGLYMRDTRLRTLIPIRKKD